MITRVYSRSSCDRQLALEQLRRTAQAAERVLDLVRELARHHAAAALLHEQRRVARHARGLGRVGDLDQHAARHVAAASGVSDTSTW